MGLFDNIFKKPIEVNNLTKTNPKRATEVISYEQELTRWKQDIYTWRESVKKAESYNNPNRKEYYRMLKDVVLDNHLSSVMQQRKQATLCREVCFYNADGTENEAVSELFESHWFNKLRSMMYDAKYYGFTLIDLGELIDDKFPNISEVQRQYVKPEFGIVVANTSDMTGISLDDPKYAKWNIFIGEQRDLGILMKAAPWALWKKTVIGYWSEYCEKFGMPMRIGKTNINDKVMVDNMFNALKNMGSAAYGVLNLEDEIELKETFNTAAYDIYDKFIERANSEMSKLILSQTGTTDEKTYAGSAGVHNDVLAKLVESDVSWHDANLNEYVKPVLAGLGFPVSDGYFESKYEETASLKDKVEMVAKFLPYMKFDKEYLEEEFDIKIESINEPKTTKPTNDLRRYYDTL